MNTRKKGEFMRINIRLPKSMYDVIMVKSAETGLSQSAITYIALDSYFNARQAINVIGDVLKRFESSEQM